MDNRIFSQMKCWLLSYVIFINEIQNKNCQHVSSMVSMNTILLRTKQCCQCITHTLFYELCISMCELMKIFSETYEERILEVVISLNSYVF